MNHDLISLSCGLFSSLGSFQLLNFHLSPSKNPVCNFEMASSACFKGLINEGQGLHVLAVDDSLIDRKCIEKLLKNSAYKVTTVESGLRALEYLGLGEEPASTMRANASDLKINLIITDYCMPGMTGFELLKKIKESSAMKEIPVVVMSSENVPTRINMCLEQGAKEFMLKPLNQSDVKRLRCHMMMNLHEPSNERLCLGM